MIELLRNRRSIRRFLGRPIEAQKIALLTRRAQIADFAQSGTLGVHLR